MHVYLLGLIQLQHSTVETVWSLNAIYEVWHDTFHALDSMKKSRHLRLPTCASPMIPLPPKLNMQRTHCSVGDATGTRVTLSDAA